MDTVRIATFTPCPLDSKLPVIGGRHAIRAFERLGYEQDHQTGSHVVLRLEMPPRRRLVVPLHSTLAKGTLRALIRQAGLTVEAFVVLLS